METPWLGMSCKGRAATKPSLTLRRQAVLQLCSQAYIHYYHWYHYNNNKNPLCPAWDTWDLVETPEDPGVATAYARYRRSHPEKESTARLQGFRNRLYWTRRKLMCCNYEMCIMDPPAIAMRGR